MDPEYPEIVETPNVESVTTATTAITLGHSASTFLTVISDTKIFLKIGGSDVAAPNKTTDTGDGRCWMIPADTEWTKHLDAAQTHMRLLSDSGTALVRWYVEQKT